MLKRYGHLLEGALCVAAVLGVAVAAYWPLLQRGATPMDLSAALSLPPWQEARAMGEAAGADPATLLQSQRYYPWYAWISSGASVLWNSTEGLGAPFLAAWRTRVLSPFTLPLYFMPLQPALVWSAVLKLAIAGACAYYAARRFGFPPATSLLAAATYGLGAPFLIASPTPLSDVLPWLPLLVVSIERLVLGQWSAWPLTALVLALMALGGDPHALTVAAIIAVLYAAIRSITDVRAPSTPRTLISTVIAVLAALGLAAVQLAPFREFTNQGDTLLGAPAFAGVSDLLAILHPGLVSSAGHASPSLAALLHVGLTPLLLLPLWLAVREFAQPTQRGRIETFVLIATVLSAAAVGAGRLLQYSLDIDGPGPEHFFMFNAWAFAIMGAAAAQEWIELTIDEARIAFRRLTRLLPAMWGGAFLLAIIWVALRGQGGWLQLGVVLLTAMAVLLLLGVTLFRPNARLLSYGLAVTSAASLFLCLAPARPVTEADRVFPQTAVVSALQKIGGRIGGSPKLEEWPVAANGIPQVYQSSGLLLNRLREFLARVHEDPLLMRRTGAQGLLLTTEDIRGPYASVRPVLNIREVFTSGAILFRDNAAQPRARMIYAGKRTEKYAPDQVRSDGPPVLESSTLPEKDEGPVAKAAIVEDAPDRIVLKVEKTRPAVLVVADAWYPGWRATVDGAPAEVVRVDGIFRGVELGEGEHDVVLEYVPASLRWGMAISALSALVVLAGLLRFARSE